MNGDGERPSIVYISYDGLLEPLGQSQVLAYLEHLARDWAIDIISFEKPADWQKSGERASVAKRCADAGLRWHPLRYHKRPSAIATAYDIAVGAWLAARLVKRSGARLVHARSYVPGLMALAAKRMTGARFLFDIRGFWADERVDGGIWPAGSLLYRLAKKAERLLFRNADHVVTLTQASVGPLQDLAGEGGLKAPVTVIPTCADLDRFTIQGPLRTRPFVLGHIGSVGTWYLLDEMLAAFAALLQRRPDARLLIVNRGEHDLVRARMAASGIDPAKVELRSCDPAEMPGQIARMSAGMAIIKPVFSKTASAATKLAEYLGCGVPCLGNVGVGDMAAILEGERVGIALEAFDSAAILKGIDRLLALCEEPGIEQRCRRAAETHFALDRLVTRYDDIYRSLSR